jgi:hypothetical protein
MPFVPAVDTVELAPVMTLEGQQCQNVYHLRKLSTWTLEDLTAAADAYIAWWNATGKNIHTTQTALVKVLVRDLDAIDAPAIERVEGLPVSGTITGGTHPGNVSIAIKWLTGLRGRSFRGRTFHIGVPMTWLDNSQVSSTAGGLLANAYAALIDAFGAAGFDLSVCSKFSGGVARTACAVTTIIGVFINPVSDSQRRRLPERGT